MNLAGLYSRTQVTFSPGIAADQLILNGELPGQPHCNAPAALLDQVRNLSGVYHSARVESENNFPTGTASPRLHSGFAALALAASKALGLELDEPALSRLARRHSGSAAARFPAALSNGRLGMMTTAPTPSPSLLPITGTWSIASP